MKMFCVLTVAGLAGTALAGDITSINSLVPDLRVFNDFGNSTLTEVHAGLSGKITEGPFNLPTGPGTFANKHRYFLSNNGTSAYSVDSYQPFELQFDYKLSLSYAGTQPGVARKEGAFEVYVPEQDPVSGVRYTNEGRFLVASKQQGTLDEIAVFGGSMPFTGFGNVYTAGSTVRLRMIYTPGDGVPLTGPQATLNVGYSTDGGLTWTMGGVKNWDSDRSDGFVNGTRFAFVGQNSPITPGDPAGLNQVVEHEWNVVSLVPAPGALGLIGLGGLAMARRRR
jgi:hypothetical protein